jgi:prepilin-type processing-associated H-X9-DG protein
MGSMMKDPGGRVARTSLWPRASGFAAAFTIVELMTVIGIIGIIIGILMPSLSRVRQHAKKITCQSNMRQVGQLLLMYANGNNGWIYPVGPEGMRRLGIFVPEQQRWPVFVKGLGQWNHRLLRCPQDDGPVAEHSYVLNYYIVTRNVRFHKHDLGGLTASDFVVMGEKRRSANNYFIGSDNDYDVAAEPYKHGILLGSNYLFLDTHVSTNAPAFARRAYNPWDSATGQ